MIVFRSKLYKKYKKFSGLSYQYDTFALIWRFRIGIFISISHINIAYISGNEGVQMKWFKHFSDNHRGKSIQVLFDEMGHMGVSCYYILMEICSEKLEKNSDKCLEEADLLFSFHQRILRQNLKISLANLRKLLNICQTFGQISYEEDGNIFKIKTPILLDLLEYDQKRPRKQRASAAIKTRLEEETEKEQEKDTDTETDKEFAKSPILPLIPISVNSKSNPKKTSLTSEQKDLNRRIWASYQDAYLFRYKIEPIRNAKVNGIVSMLRQRLGEEAIDVVKFYLESNHSFYVGKTHSISHCLNDCETLRTQMLKGKAITPTMIKNYEKQNQEIEFNQQIETMWKDDNANSK